MYIKAYYIRTTSFSIVLVAMLLFSIWYTTAYSYKAQAHNFTLLDYFDIKLCNFKDSYYSLLFLAFETHKHQTIDTVEPHFCILSLFVIIIHLLKCHHGTTCNHFTDITGPSQSIHPLMWEVWLKDTCEIMLMITNFV